MDEITHEERERAKHICYGILYGGGPNNLAEKLHISEEEAILFISNFKAKYEG